MSEYQDINQTRSSPPIDWVVSCSSEYFPGASNERRSAERHVVVLQLALLACETSKQLCLVHNIGPGGMKLRLYGDRPTSDKVSITLRGERTYAGTISWQDNDLLGIALDTPLDSNRLVEALSENGARMRGPRLPVELQVSVRCGADTIPARLLNISPSGAALDLGGAHLEERTLTVHVQGLHPLEAQIRWSNGDQVGLSFNTPLLLKQLQHAMRSCHEPIVAGYQTPMPTGLRASSLTE